MIKRSDTPAKDELRLVLDAIRQGRRTWDEIVASTKLPEKRLGIILCELFTQKSVKVEYHSGERRYRLL
jgi:hypothetical protein